MATVEIPECVTVLFVCILLCVQDFELGVQINKMGNFPLFKQKNRPNDIGTNGLMGNQWVGCKYFNL